jgi:hypothetical protein
MGERSGDDEIKEGRRNHLRRQERRWVWMPPGRPRFFARFVKGPARRCRQTIVDQSRIGATVTFGHVVRLSNAGQPAKAQPMMSRQDPSPIHPRFAARVARRALKYDKGDRRMKHVGTSSEPEIVVDPGQPRKLVGKCPKGLEKSAAVILRRSIAGSNGDRPGSYFKHRYAVHNGTIYEAATSDKGETYHGYPYGGKLPKALVAELRKCAVREKTEDRFDKWVDDHIIFHGSWRA